MEISIDKVPEYKIGELARAASGGIGAFYADPENRRKFEEWKAKRQRPQREESKC